VKGSIRMRRLLRKPRLRIQQVLVAAVMFSLGVLLLVVGGNTTGSLGSILSAFGYATIGAVGIPLLYDLLLSPAHDEQVLAVVQDGLIAKGTQYGLASIEALDLLRVIRRLGPHDELCWLETFCPGLELPEVETALIAAVDGGASVRMLMIRPDSDVAAARGRELSTRPDAATAFQNAARIQSGYLRSLRRRASEAGRKRFEIEEYRDLPCAPMYLRLRHGRLVEGWTSYFLSVATDEAAHVYWSRPSTESSGLPVGLGLDAFHRYFNEKWEVAKKNRGAPGSPIDLLGETMLDELEKLHEKPFALKLLEYEMRRNVGKRIRTEADDGRFFRKQDVATQDLLIAEAEKPTAPADSRVRLVHSTSEGDLSHEPAFWQRFNDKLLAGVREHRLRPVRRLFIIEPSDGPSERQTLRDQVSAHDGKTFKCRLLTRGDYDRIQGAHAVTDTPVHDFGIYGSAAYVWPHGGYHRGLDQVSGYFQVDEATVGRFRSLFDDCWAAATSAKDWLATVDPPKRGRRGSVRRRR
jgi:hypothetical protein